MLTIAHIQGWLSDKLYQLPHFTESRNKEIIGISRVSVLKL